MPIKVNKLLLFFILLHCLFSQTNGIISGTVLDKATQQSLPGANIIIEKLGIGTASDLDGNFRLYKIPIGTQHLRVSMMGYEDRIFLNIPVTSARPINIIAELDVQPIIGETVEVKSKAFTRSKSSTVSTMHVDLAEIKSDPGGAYDIQRVVQSLPSVTTASDQENEIISRGGLPGENLFLLDNIEIQNPNHFGFEGAGGGPVNMINPAFVREIEFTPGAFSAKYGDKASSVMDITLRDGSREEFEYDFDLSMSGAGTNFEGPIGGKGSFMASSKWSYLDLVVKNLGMTAVPKYSSHQAKVVYDLSQMNRLTFNYLLAFDEIHIKGENEVVSKGAENVDWKSRTDVAGLSLRTLLGKIGYGVTTLSSVKLDQNTMVYRNGDTEQKYFTRNNLNFENTLKSDWTFKLIGFEMLTGLSAKQLDVGFDQWADADTIWTYDTSFWNGNEWDFSALDEITEPVVTGFAQTTPEWDFISDDIAYKFAHYIEFHKSVLNKLNFRFGLRTDYFTETKESVYSPRANVEFGINQISTIHFGIGRHYQFPPNYLVFRDEKNRYLKSKYSDQIILGYEHYLDSDLRLSLETYYKKHENIPTQYYWSHNSDEIVEEHLNEWLNEGKARSYGLEFFVQKKMMNNWHGLISYAWSHSEASDVRNIFGASELDDANPGDNWYDWDFDIRHQLTIIGGWKKKFHTEQWYNDLKQKTLYKVFSSVFGMINPLADEIELSFRFGYNSGRPFTKKDYDEATMRWLVDENVEWNTNRFPEYHRFDILFQRRYHFKKVNLVTFIDVMNIYNRNNIWDYSYNSDGTKDKVWQYQTFPVGGFTLEF